MFAVKGRENFILTEWRDDLHKYISGITTGKGAKSLAVGGWKDHVHIFFGMPVTTCIADFVGGIKAISSGWVNDNKLIRGVFRWQSGYGAVSHSKSQRDTVIKYIINQEKHHKIKTFKEEYLKRVHSKLSRPTLMQFRECASPPPEG